MPFWRDANGALREIEGSFARYVDALAPYFDEVIVCAPEAGAARTAGTAIRSSNVTWTALPAFDGPVHFYPQLPKILPRLGAFVRRIDVLHCRVPTPAASFAFAFARLLGRPAFVLVVGDLRALTPTLPYRGLKRLLWRGYVAFEELAIQAMANRSLTFANGAALAAKHARPGHPVVQTQTTTIEASDLRERPDVAERSRARLLTVSRIDPRKGLRVLPGVVAQLVERGLDATLDIVGPEVGAPGAAEADAIRREAEALGIADRVAFPGAVALEELLPMYARHDAFVLPTLPGEGVPRVLLEAMAAGLPVVATRVAGIPSLVTHEHNGLLVDQPDVPLLVDAIARIFTEDDLRRRVVAGGYATARANTLDAQASRMMADVSSALGLALRVVPRPA
jgi:glycosyltransferase involved in cell wall biosynthesis